MYRRDLFPPPSSQNHSPEVSRVDQFFFSFPACQSTQGFKMYFKKIGILDLKGREVGKNFVFVSTQKGGRLMINTYFQDLQ